MISLQLLESLRRIFEQEDQRIVFWYDGDREFEDDIVELKLDGVRVIRLDQIGAMELKVLLELEDLSGKHLIYAPFPEPATEI